MHDHADSTITTATPSDLAEMVAIDDDAGALFAAVGVTFDLPPEHPFVVAERGRWLHAVEAGDAFLAHDAGRVVGMLVMGWVDGAPYLDQLSVRSQSMRQGIGTRLLRQAITWAGARALWLTTYAHVPWNRPYYERAGFVVVAEGACPAGIRHHLREQRAALPDPDQRVAMVKRAP